MNGIYQNFNDLSELNFEKLKNTFLDSVNQCDSKNSLEKIKADYLGKDGYLSFFIKKLPSFDIAIKKQYGSCINDFKNFALSIIEERLNYFNIKKIEQNLKEYVDLSLPGRKYNSIGSLHPITQVNEQIKNIFSTIGFNVAFGPEIENDKYNFEALNIPKHHPAKTMHDTFYTSIVDENSENYLLRTHTSNVQIRSMLAISPPMKIISVGRVYRKDLDATHTPMFHQVEGLVVDENINFSNLKNILFNFLKIFFANDNLSIRFRPSYFPFTEPSAEVDIECVHCARKGCSVCKNTGWLEVLGCGVVNQNVLKFVNIDYMKYRGIAFGMGTERLAMIKYKIPDLRLFYENNLDFLKQLA